MKDEQRERWGSLANIVLPWGKFGTTTQSLCHFCRYAEWISSGPCDESTELECRHKLEAVSQDSDDVWSGGDCWGFRPNTTWDDAIQYVAQRLVGEWPDYPRRGWRLTNVLSANER